jgi:hypothetical protein
MTFQAFVYTFIGLALLASASQYSHACRVATLADRPSNIKVIHLFLRNLSYPPRFSLKLKHCNRPVVAIN